MFGLSKTRFEEALAENLSLYTSNAPENMAELFSTHREIALARYALSKQAESYFTAIEVLTNILGKVSDTADAKTVQNILIAIEAIETKSQKLIDSVQRVTNLLGTIVEIDVDKTKLRSMVVALPSLVKEVIEETSHDTQLAERISLRLNNRISDLMIAVRFADPNVLDSQSQSNSQGAITLDTYRSLFNTVPVAPCVEH